MISRDCIQDKIKTTRYFFDLFCIAGKYKMMCTQALGIFFLGGCMAEHGHICTHGYSQFYTHVPKPAKAKHRNFMSFSNFPVAQRRVSGNTGTKQRCNSFQW